MNNGTVNMFLFATFITDQGYFSQFQPLHHFLQFQFFFSIPIPSINFQLQLQLPIVVVDSGIKFNSTTTKLNN